MKNNLSRMTRQRNIIMEELQKVKSHPTADELYAIVRQRLPHISLGTVYRNLEILSEQGLILKIGSPSVPSGSQKRFDANTQKHYHIKCKKCGRVEDFSFANLNKIEASLPVTHAYDNIEPSLEFTGLCPGCQDSNEINIEDS